MASLSEQIVEALRAELGRQAESGGLSCRSLEDDRVELDGRVDLQALAQAVAGAVAGGP